MSTMTGRAESAHTPRVVFAAVVAVVLAFLCQTALLPAVGLSAAVPVVFVTVAVLATALGSGSGAVIGFGAGLLLDLTGTGVLGVGALTGCLLGAAAGRIRVDRWRWSGLPQVWLGTVAASCAFSLVNAVAEGLPVTWTWGWLWILGGSLACALLLVPLRPWIRAVVR